MNLQIINPIEYPNWDDLLLTSGDHSFFHTSAWARVLVESYNYKPLYFSEISEGRLSLLFPFMEVNSIITGKRGVSIPFTDYCDVIVNDPDKFRGAWEQIVAYGRDAEWKHIDLRGGGEYLPEAIPSLSHYTHDLRLNGDEKEIFNNFKENTRRNIKKALKESVEVRLENSFESVKEFFRLNIITRKRHGLPPQPFRLFKNIYDHIILKKNGFISLAHYKKKIIAGAIFFHFNKNAIYKYGASKMDYSRLRPNNLVMWEAIKWYLKNSFTSFSFGITEQSNKGLLQFKRTWRAEEGIVNYYKYNILKDDFEKDEFRAKTSYSFFRKMPSPMLNLTGALIYRHFG